MQLLYYFYVIFLISPGPAPNLRPFFLHIFMCCSKKQWTRHSCRIWERSQFVHYIYCTTSKVENIKLEKSFSPRPFLFNLWLSVKFSKIVFKRIVLIEINSPGADLEFFEVSDEFLRKTFLDRPN